jgi:hypothetical protein
MCVTCNVQVIARQESALSKLRSDNLALTLEVTVMPSNMS